MHYTDFLKQFRPHGPWHLVAIWPDTNNVEAGKFQTHQINQLIEWVEARQKKANLYFHVNFCGASFGLKAEKQHVTRAEWLHVDVDPRIGEDTERERARILKRLQMAQPAPNLIIDSGGGYQGFWRLDEAVQIGGDPEKVADFELYNLALAQTLEGDKCHNIERIMRLPATWNMPNERKRKKGRVPVLASVVHFDAGTVGLNQCRKAPPLANVSKVVVELKDVRQLKSVDELDRVHPAVRMVIVQGSDPAEPDRWPSRSEALLWVCCELIRAGYDNDTIAAVLLDKDFGISASVHDSKNPQRYAKRQIERAREFCDNLLQKTDKNGTPIESAYVKSMENTRKALLKLGLQFEYDTFASRAYVYTDAIRSLITDKVFSDLRLAVIRRFDRFDPGKENIFDAAMSLCYENDRDPVREYLDGLKWDGKPRLRRWMTTYLGCEDTGYIRAVGRITLVGAVRRVRQPGCKFDTMPVWEGPQGGLKSTAVKVLAGEWYSDSDLLSESTKERALRLQGNWLYEVAELAGITRRDLETLKAFLSRGDDKTRLPYGRVDEPLPRRCILIGTTNKSHYLSDETGNRRFLPVKVGTIDIKALRRDRDQLWAEASYYEQCGMQIFMPQKLVPVAAAETAQRMELEPWVDILREVEGISCLRDDGARVRRVSSTFLMKTALGLTPKDCHPGTARQLKRAMGLLGWDGPKVRKIHRESHNSYERLENSSGAKVPF